MNNQKNPTYIQDVSHLRLQDLFLDRYKDYLLQGNTTDYDEKMRTVQHQYEIMLDNFQKKSFRL